MAGGSRGKRGGIGVRVVERELDRKSTGEAGGTSGVVGITRGEMWYFKGLGLRRFRILPTLIGGFAALLALGLLYASGSHPVVYRMPDRVDACNATVERMVQEGLTPLTCNGRTFDAATGTFR
jgi:hypothetical protein